MSRTYIPPRLRGLAAPPNCDPYYKQPHLPLIAGTAIGTPATNPPLMSDLRERFHKFASIVTPAAGSTNTLITSYTVPAGSLARVVGLLFFYQGAGFIEGDATLLYWSLRLNGAGYIRDYDVIPNTLGSLTSGPWPVPAGINLNAGDLLEVLVTVPGGSTITTGGTTRVHGHLLGYYWPASA